MDPDKGLSADQDVTAEAVDQFRRRVPAGAPEALAKVTYCGGRLTGHWLRLSTDPRRPGPFDPHNDDAGALREDDPLSGRPRFEFRPVSPEAYGHYLRYLEDGKGEQYTMARRCM